MAYMYFYISCSVSPSGGLVTSCLMNSFLSHLRDNLWSRSAVEHKGMSKVQWPKVVYNGHAYNYIHIMDESK